MLLTKSEAAARRVLQECGLDDISSLVNANLRRLILSRGAYYEEIDLKGKDGRIVTFEGRSIISISSGITDRGKKRFTAAHELGHFEMHKDLAVNADTHYELCNWYQAGHHEKEANEFASELLMPSNLFSQQCKNQKFRPELIDQLSATFLVSKTAAILKFVKSGNHPVCVVCTKDNKVKWWKMSKDMETAEHEFIPNWLRYKVKVTSNLPPPVDSVVGQLFKTNSRYQIQERFQEIEKSTWFLTKPEDDPKMFEFCHFVPSYNFALSIVWED